jgi:predicted ArsR family transcriptional regulator
MTEQEQDDPGRPQAEDPAHRTAPNAEQTISLSTQQAAQQLGVEPRTVRRYISDGINIGGVILRLEARPVRRKNGQEWQIYQPDLEAFQKERDRAATEGQGQVMRAEERESQALTTLTTSIQIIAEELERRSQALSQAQETIERLAREAGKYAGKNEELERERDSLRERVTALEQEREQWQQLAKVPQPRRIRLLPWTKKTD